MYNNSKRKYKQYLFEGSNSNIPKRTKRRWNKDLKNFQDVQKCQDVNRSDGIISISNNIHSKTITSDVNTSQSTSDTEFDMCYINEESKEQIVRDDSSSSDTDSSGTDISGINDNKLKENDCSIDSDETDNNNNNSAGDLEEVLFPQSGLTKKGLLTIVQALTLKHRLTHEARKDILEMIKLIGNLNEEVFQTSNYTMAKHFNQSDDSLSYVFYCDQCKTELQAPVKRNFVKPRYITCPNLKCAFKQKISHQSKNMFISVDIIGQLKSVLDEDTLKYSLQTPKLRGESISDIYDGSIYKNLKRNIDFDLTLNFSTDGAPIFSSSKLSMWPIQCIVNELPPKLRFKRLIFAGIWVGKGEPNVHLMNTIMNTFTKQFEELFKKGITINAKLGNLNFKILALLCPCDSIARPCLQNRIQFNGYFGCSWCYQKGECIGRQVKYPFKKDEYSILRSKDSYIRDLREAADKNFTEKIRGLKGPSSLIMQLPYFDPVWGFPIDYMHGVILGVVRQLWDLWTTFTPENKHSFYLGRPDTLKMINQRLIAIRPPHEISRLPRSINEKAKWKASEWRSWLLFYALPCLNGILKADYLNHFALLVKAIYTLLQEKISSDDLNETQRYLEKFVIKFEKHYGSCSMTFNVHSLLHLTESVKRSGPLWATSTFPFESGIYRLKQQVAGPVGVAMQIARKMCDINMFINYLNNFKVNDTCTLFCKNLWSKKKSYNEEKDLTFLGAGSLIAEDELSLYLSTAKMAVQLHEPAVSYKKCMYKQIMLHSSKYTQATKTNDKIVKIKSGEIVDIQTLFSYNNENYMFVKKLSIKKLKIGTIEFDHIYTVYTKENSKFQLLPINDTCQKCIVIGDKTSILYICTFPNFIETSL